MNLEDVFQQLGRGELSQVFASDTEGGTIAAESRVRIAASISLGLTELHKRFLLKEKALIVDLTEDQNTYLLTKDYAVSNTRSTQLVKYINDVGNPYLGDILAIERIYDNNGNELPLNNVDNPLSVRTPSYNCIELGEDIDTPSIKVVYRANHPELNPAFVGNYPPKVPIDIPLTHLEALLFYVASRVHNPIGLRSAEFHEGNNYAAKFEQACARLDQLNLRVDTMVNNDRLNQNGWV